MRFLTAGESHGPALTAIIEGLPAGLTIDLAAINEEMFRRQQGYGRGGRMAIEKDQVEVLSGIRSGLTLGSPITLQVVNRDWDNNRQVMAPFDENSTAELNIPRPGHADYAGMLKYDQVDMRNILERASARETAARVAVGAIAKQLLAVFDIYIASHVVNIGGVKADLPSVDYVTVANSRDQDFACLDAIAREKMRQVIDEAKQHGDTLGGIIEVVTSPVLVGLGAHTHWDARLDAKISAAIMSIPAIKGIEFGEGFGYADLPGSKAHDEFVLKAGAIERPTSHAGGLEGGITNGQPIVFRAVMKPIPTLMQPLASVDIKKREAVLAAKVRSDVCAVPAAGVVAEAMTAMVLADAILDKFGHDCLTDIKGSVDAYRRRLVSEKIGG